MEKWERELEEILEKSNIEPEGEISIPERHIATLILEMAKTFMKNQRKTFHVETGWGEDGEVDCPRCSQTIPVGSKAMEVTCANCSERIPIKRTGIRPIE